MIDAALVFAAIKSSTFGGDVGFAEKRRFFTAARYRRSTAVADI